MDWLTVAKVLVVLAAILTFSLFASLAMRTATAEKVRCSVFPSQEAAQRSYRKSLDRDGNGLACDGFYYKKKLK